MLSVRSVPGFNLYQALHECKDFMIQFGGHEAAAGLTLLPENYIAFKKRFQEIVAKNIQPHQLEPEINIEGVIHFNQITPKFVRILKQLAPFGPQNMAPVFCTKNITFVGTPQIVGTNHLKINVKQQNSTIFEAIGFNLGEFEKLLKPNQAFSICYTIEENNWRDKKRLQLNIKGIKIEE